MSDAYALFEEVSNPLDSVEDFLHGNEWIFSRPHPDELAVAVEGKSSTYRLTFFWQEEFSAMQFFCEYDLAIAPARVDLALRALRAVNEGLWLGHFDLPAATRQPTFRHTSLFRGWTHSSGAEHIEDLVEIALAECERHQTIFALLAGEEELDDHGLALMLAGGSGRA